ncbi:MAG: DUF1987 domain-containing protein [Bacteroidia bacterium]|nr:DUF1987 domain-containing protein [Bacteroidia bacterium]
MRLFIQGSSSHPSVLFDIERKFLRIDGVSSMADSAQFYNNLLQWLIDHRPYILPDTRLVLRLLYLNSGTHKALFHFLREIVEERIPVQVIFIRTSRFDNTEEVELLIQICRQVGLSCSIQEESESSELLSG